MNPQELLDKLDDYDHTQGAVLALRPCASWCKLVYSCRTTPPHLLHSSLSAFSQRLHASLETQIGVKLFTRHRHGLRRTVAGEGGTTCAG